MMGVIVLFVQIGALWKRKAFKNNNLEISGFSALRPFHANWCAHTIHASGQTADGQT
jgi:hypothetical protein